LLTESEIQILTQHKTSLFSLRGELLWRSPAWVEMGTEAGVGREEAGLRWMEYVAPDDLDYVRAWFAGTEAGETGGHAVFRMLIPATRRWVGCIWSKELLRGDWLVVGTTVEVAGVPVPPGVAEAMRLEADDPARPRRGGGERRKNRGGGGDLIRRGGRRPANATGGVVDADAGGARVRA
jgi:hypothetical protein